MRVDKSTTKINLRRVAGFVLVALVGAILTVGCSRGDEPDGNLQGSCSAQSNSRGIRNGTADGPCQYRAALAILPMGATSFSDTFCSGTLIEPDIVLTAAHCISREAQKTFGNRFIVATSGSAPVNVSAFIAHPKFIETQEAVGGVDIGILRLETTMEGIAPLPLGNSVPARGSTAIAIGYGYDGNGADGDGNLGIRRTTTMRVNDVGGLSLVQPSDDVANSLANTLSINSQETCAADSGGPLLVANALLGVLSGGTYNDTSQSCRSAADSDYILVAPFRSWIAQAIARLRATR